MSRLTAPCWKRWGVAFGRCLLDSELDPAAARSVRAKVYHKAVGQTVTEFSHVDNPVSNARALRVFPVRPGGVAALEKRTPQ